MNLGLLINAKKIFHCSYPLNFTLPRYHPCISWVLAALLILHLLTWLTNNCCTGTASVAGSVIAQVGDLVYSSQDCLQARSNESCGGCAPVIEFSHALLRPFYLLSTPWCQSHDKFTRPSSHIRGQPRGGAGYEANLATQVCTKCTFCSLAIQKLYTSCLPWVSHNYIKFILFVCCTYMQPGLENTIHSSSGALHVSSQYIFNGWLLKMTLQLDSGHWTALLL